MNTFENYSHEQFTLTFDEMQQIHAELLEEIRNDGDAVELYDDVVDAATRYAAIRAEWLRISVNKKAEIDSRRTSFHNNVIIRLNILARYLRMQGKKAAWRDRLGNEEENKYFRKTIGDFGCYIVFVNSLMAR